MGVPHWIDKGILVSNYIKNKKINLFRHRWILTLAVAVLVVVSFRSAIADWYDIPSGSMEPTILVGDRIFVNKLAYDLKVPFTTYRLVAWKHPKRGDVVVFSSPVDRARLIKRIAGVPGDVIAMRNNRLFVNGQSAVYDPLSEEICNQIEAERQPFHQFFVENMSGASHPVMMTPSQPAIHTFGPDVVPEGYYFMLGDNRDNSGDSRYWGYVAKHQIEGQALGVALSLDRTHYIRPRWHRFFQSLQ